jgi:hypothetical protein
MHSDINISSISVIIELLNNNGIIIVVGALHKFHACDGCDEAPIRGMRWRCLHCGDYDLCSECYMNDVHNLDHAFERFQGMKTMGYVFQTLK